MLSKRTFLRGLFASAAAVLGLVPVVKAHANIPDGHANIPDGWVVKECDWSYSLKFVPGVDHQK